MVEDVEDLGAKLEIKSIVDLRVLNHRKIEFLQPRPDVLVAAGVAESSTWGRRHKTFKLDEIVRVVPINRIGTGRCIYMIRKVESVRILQSERIATRRDRKRQTGPTVIYTTQLPTTCDPFERTILRGSERRNLPKVIEGQVLAHIKTGQAAETVCEEREWRLDIIGESAAGDRGRAVIETLRPGIRETQPQSLLLASHVYVHPVISVRCLPEECVD